jgi:hypothetical protein
MPDSLSLFFLSRYERNRQGDGHYPEALTLHLPSETFSFHLRGSKQRTAPISGVGLGNAGTAHSLGGYNRVRTLAWPLSLPLPSSGGPMRPSCPRLGSWSVKCPHWVKIPIFSPSLRPLVAVGPRKIARSSKNRIGNIFARAFPGSLRKSPKKLGAGRLATNRRPFRKLARNQVVESGDSTSLNEGGRVYG